MSAHVSSRKAISTTVIGTAAVAAMIGFGFAPSAAADPVGETCTVTDADFYDPSYDMESPTAEMFSNQFDAQFYPSGLC